jgi:hypothetical protein
MQARRTHNLRRTRRGTTLLECVIALGVLAAALTLGAQVLAWSAAQRRLGDQRHVALQEAANCLERVRQMPWEELTAERLATLDLSSEARQRLTSAELHVAPEEIAGQPSAKRVEVEIQWLTRHGETPLRVALVTWRYKTGEVE